MTILELKVHVGLEVLFFRWYWYSLSSFIVFWESCCIEQMKGSISQSVYFCYEHKSKVTFYAHGFRIVLFPGELGRIFYLHTFLIFSFILACIVQLFYKLGGGGVITLMLRRSSSCNRPRDWLDLRIVYEHKVCLHFSQILRLENPFKYNVIVSQMHENFFLITHSYDTYTLICQWRDQGLAHKTCTWAHVMN